MDNFQHLALALVQQRVRCEQGSKPKTSLPPSRFSNQLHFSPSPQDPYPSWLGLVLVAVTKRSQTGTMHSSEFEPAFAFCTIACILRASGFGTRMFRETRLSSLFHYLVS